MQNIHSKLLKQLIFFSILFITILVLGRNLNPFSHEMFLFHDETQAARIQEFSFNILHGNIPPRIAPHFSFGLGYPVFNFYAPFAYWVTAGINLLNVPVIASIKLSMIIAIVTAFTGMMMLTRKYIPMYGSLLSSVVYTASPYIALEIFVRGNLAELWFYAVLPWAFYVLKTNSKARLLLTSLVLSFLFTSHNVLSLVSILLVTAFVILEKNKRINLISIATGILLSSYFFIPFFGEMNLVPASEVATTTDYKDHFVCLSQIWSSPWGFAGSALGCEADGISFMIGKANILLGIAGLGISLYTILKNKISHANGILLIAALMIGSIFMVTSASDFIWKLTEPVSSVFQFPWRLLLFVLFGLSFFSGWVLQIIPKRLQLVMLLVLCIGVLYTNHDYFYGNTISTEEYSNRFLSEEYINTSVAYKIAEYLPVTADYNYWRSIEGNEKLIDTTEPIIRNGNQEVSQVNNDPFKKSATVRSSENQITFNIHYAPYWRMFVGNERYLPNTFDELGRPIITIPANQFITISAYYQQTRIEHIANSISVVTLLILTLYTVIQLKPSWLNIATKKN